MHNTSTEQVLKLQETFSLLECISEQDRILQRVRWVRKGMHTRLWIQVRLRCLVVAL
jgi:hypothetical protein